MIETAPAADTRSVGVGTGLASTSVLSVQFGAALAAHLFAAVGPLGAVTLRLAGASVVLILLTRPWRRRWTRPDLVQSALFGAAFTAMNVTLYLAIARLPLATAITIEFLGPLTVAVVSARGRHQRIWALPAAGGVALLGGTLSLHDLIGVVLAVSAACCWATYIVLSGRLGRSGTGLAGLAVASGIGLVVMVPVGLATAGAAALLQPASLAVGAAVGVLSSAIPYSLDLLALRRLPTAVFGVLTSLNPAVASLAGLAVLGQSPTLLQVAGIALVVCAGIGVTVSRVRAPEDDAVPGAGVAVAAP